MTALLEKAFAEVFAQARQLPEAEQDAVAERLLQTMTQWTEEHTPRPRFGSAKGMGYMTADFEEPLEEFKGYME